MRHVQRPAFLVHVLMSLCSCCHARAGLELACLTWHGSSVICGCRGGQLLSVDAAGHVAVLDCVPLPSAAERGGCEDAAACLTQQPAAGSQATAPSDEGEAPPALCQAAEPKAAPAEADAAMGTGMPQPDECSRGVPAAPAAAAGQAGLAEGDPAAVACVAVADGLLVAACARRRGTVLRCGVRAEANTCTFGTCTHDAWNAASHCLSMLGDSDLPPLRGQPAAAHL